MERVAAAAMFVAAPVKLNAKKRSRAPQFNASQTARARFPSSRGGTCQPTALRRTRTCSGAPAAFSLPTKEPTPVPCRLTSATATSAHRALHRAVADAVQGFLAGVTPHLQAQIFTCPEVRQMRDRKRFGELIA